MSHTDQNTSSIQTVPFAFTIVNYATGGEAVSPTEFGGATPITGVVFGDVPPGLNSLGITLFPLLVAGKVTLREFSGGVFTEIPTTNNLNATVVGFIFG